MITWNSFKDMEPTLKETSDFTRNDGVRVIMYNTDVVLLYNKSKGNCIGFRIKSDFINPDGKRTTSSNWHVLGGGGSIRPTHWSELNKPTHKKKRNKK